MIAPPLNDMATPYWLASFVPLVSSAGDLEWWYIYISQKGSRITEGITVLADCF